jgi:hypothetical protein
MMDMGFLSVRQIAANLNLNMVRTPVWLEVLPPEFYALWGGSPDGGENTGTKRDRPAFRLPRLSHHNLDAQAKDTKTRWRVLCVVWFRVLRPATDFAAAG